MKSYITNKNNIKVKLIFNPNSGSNGESPVQLMDVTKEMQEWKLIPETYIIEPDCDLMGVVQDSIDQGFVLFVVCGGDGTVSAVAKALVGTNAILGIVPTGTQNNVALSLGIPTNIKDAVSIIRMGQCCNIDVGMITCGSEITSFIEVCSVGLFSNLFPAGDDIQHGDLTKIGDFLSILATSPASDIQLILNDSKEIKKTGHIVLISNMPYIGRNNQVALLDSFCDGFLNVLFFAELSKLDLMGCFIKGISKGEIEDSRIEHYQARKILINTKPAMPIMADGIIIGEGSAQIEVWQGALAVMTNSNVKRK